MSDAILQLYSECAPTFRVWLKEIDIPGLAMSRSFGDDIVKPVGMTCDPEIREIELENQDKFIIMASDGVWEFITN